MHNVKGCSASVLKMIERLESCREEILQIREKVSTIPQTFYDQHEMRVKTKFEEEKERVIQSFKSIIDRLHDKEKEFIDQMRD